MRKYEPIWNLVKTKNVASIVAPQSNHARVIKAVTKEKYNDEGYKLQLAEKGLKATLDISYHSDNPDKITFSLSFKYDESCIGVHNL